MKINKNIYNMILIKISKNIYHNSLKKEIAMLENAKNDYITKLALANRYESVNCFCFLL